MSVHLARSVAMSSAAMVAAPHLVRWARLAALDRASSLVAKKPTVVMTGAPFILVRLGNLAKMASA